ncbi:MAG: uracil-xanthine permease, partial [Clostridia bacterium]|nr:uracil-xanthine permease [Clostridia bacterium]
LALTKVYDPRVIRIAAVLAILFAFCPKFEALIACMPTATIGGVSLILYGMISAIGVRNLVENHVNLSESRNVIVVSLIMSLALGITFSAAGAITFNVGAITLKFSGLAVAAIVGIAVNALLPGNDFKFTSNYASGKKKHH